MAEIKTSEDTAEIGLSGVEEKGAGKATVIQNMTALMNEDYAKTKDHSDSVSAEIKDTKKEKVSEKAETDKLVNAKATKADASDNNKRSSSSSTGTVKTAKASNSVSSTRKKASTASKESSASKTSKTSATVTVVKSASGTRKASADKTKTTGKTSTASSAKSSSNTSSKPSSSTDSTKSQSPVSSEREPQIITYVEVSNIQINTGDVLNKVKDECKGAKKLDVYFNFDEHRAYYVADGNAEGKYVEF